MAKHFNGLSPAEAERLALLMEEMAEAQQIIGKILRHGYDRSDPTKRASPTNRQLLNKELGDVRACLEMMLDANDLNIGDVLRAKRTKLTKVTRWVHHQPKVKP